MSNNFVCLEGRVIRGQTNVTKTGKSVTKVTIVVGGSKDGGGAFIPVEIWGAKESFINMVGNVEKTKNAIALFVVGVLKMDQWKDKEGKPRSQLKVVANNYQLSPIVPRQENKKSEEDEEVEQPRRNAPAKPAAKQAPKRQSPAPKVVDEEDVDAELDVEVDDDSPF